MAFQDCYAAAQDPRVVNQIKCAFLEFATGVVGTASPPADQAQRVTLATNVLNGNVNWDALILAVCVFGSVNNATVPDATISNYVAATWSALAGG
jgi:hypothetical protein